MRRMEVYNIIPLPITSLNRFFEVKDTILCVSVSWIFKLLKGTIVQMGVAMQLAIISLATSTNFHGINTNKQSSSLLACKNGVGSGPKPSETLLLSQLRKLTLVSILFLSQLLFPTTCVSE